MPTLVLTRGLGGSARLLLTRGLGLYPTTPPAPGPPLGPPGGGLVTRGLGMRSAFLFTRGLGVRLLLPPPVQSLAEAIVLRWNALGLSPMFPGGIHRNRAPRAAAVPFVVFTDIGGSPTYFSGGSYGDGTVQFSVYAGSSLAAETLGESLRAAMIDAPFVIFNRVPCHFRPATEPVVDLDPDEGPDGKDLWTYVVTFRYVIGR